MVAAFNATILQYELIAKNRRRSLAVAMGETKVVVEFSAVCPHNHIYVNLRLVHVVGRFPIGWWCLQEVLEY